MRLENYFLMKCIVNWKAQAKVVCVSSVSRAATEVCANLCLIRLGWCSLWRGLIRCQFRNPGDVTSIFRWRYSVYICRNTPNGSVRFKYRFEYALWKIHFRVDLFMRDKCCCCFFFVYRVHCLYCRNPIWFYCSLWGISFHSDWIRCER